jgi:ATP-binding cassette, subfamily D (ALD), peroxisomal long-chain fatty acid import protein
MITVDIQRFSNHLAAIYSNIAKPLLDMILYNYQLSQNVGAESLFLLTIFVNLSARVLRAITPSFGAYTAQEAALAGSLRHTQSRLAEASEEIAFYGGEDVEKMIVERDYYGLVMHAQRVLRIRLWHGVAEEWIIKWLWGSMGVGPCRVPSSLSAHSRLFSSLFVLSPFSSNSPAFRVWILDHGQRASSPIDVFFCPLPTHSVELCTLIKVRSVSSWMHFLILRWIELAELAGYTARVSELFETMHDVKESKYQKALVSSASIEDNAKGWLRYFTSQSNLD